MTTTTRTKTVAQIIAEELAGTRAYEATTVAGVVNGQEYTIATYRAIFGAFEDKGHWKLPWTGKFASSMVPLVIDITKFFHGDVPEVIDHDEATDTVTMKGHGYQC